MPTSYGSIHLLPPLALYVSLRAQQLGISEAMLWRVLLQRYLYGPPMGLPPSLGKRGRLKRVPVACSIPVKLRREGKVRAKRWRLSFSELMESLVRYDAEDGEDQLVIYPLSGKRKPEINLP